MKSKKVLWTSYNQSGGMLKVCTSLAEHVSKDLEVIMITENYESNRLSQAMIDLACKHGANVIAVRSNMLVRQSELDAAHAAGITVIRRNTLRVPTGTIVFSKKTKRFSSVYNLTDNGWTEILEIHECETDTNISYRQVGREVTAEILEGWKC